MNHQLNPEIFEKCERAFAVSVSKTIHAVLKHQEGLSQSQRQELLSKLAFAVAAHISGSSFGGEADGEEVYPVLGFSLGETTDAVYFGRGASMHEFIASVLGELEPQPALQADAAAQRGLS